MEVIVVLQQDNPALSRKEYTLELHFKGATPKREEMKNAIVAKLGTEPELLIIKKAEQLTGRRAVRVFVYCYNDKETLMRVEPPYVLKREGLIKEENSENN